MTDYIDNFLNKITMYRLALYYLLTLLAVAAVFGFFGARAYSPLSILCSGARVTLVCSRTNGGFARVVKASTNVE